MPSNHIILCRPLLLPSVFPSIGVFSHHTYIFDEYRCKDSQPDTSTLNPRSHQKDGGPVLRWIHARVTEMLQHTQTRLSIKESAVTPESREVFYWVACWGLWAREQHLRSSEKSAPRRREGASGFIQVCNKGSRRSEEQRSDIREGIEHSTQGRMQASGVTEFTPFLCTSVVWGQTHFVVHLKER